MQCAVEYTDFSDRRVYKKLIKKEAVNYEGNTFGDFKLYDNIRKDLNNVGCKKKPK